MVSIRKVRYCYASLTIILHFISISSGISKRLLINSGNIISNAVINAIIHFTFILSTSAFANSNVISWIMFELSMTSHFKTWTSSQELSNFHSFLRDIPSGSVISSILLKFVTDFYSCLQKFARFSRVEILRSKVNPQLRWLEFSL